jgi:integrase
MHADGGGLWLQVGPTGSRSWIFRFTIAGKARAMGLGALNAVSLAQARQKAADARNLVAAGMDPIEARTHQRAPQALVTFEAAALDYLVSHEDGWHNAEHRRQWRATMEQDVFPHIGALPVSAVDTDAVLKVLRPIWSTKVETANRIRGRIESVLGAAMARGLRTGPNPATWRGNLQHLLPKKSKVRRVEHHAALPYPELPDFMVALRARPGLAAHALEFLILTAARTGEVLGARWPEIDVAAAVWTIPAGRMKSRRPHRVPLSRAALAVLAPLPRDSAFVFPGERKAGSIHNDAMSELLKKMGVAVTVHGFRSTFRDWAAERTDFPNHVVEMALAHVVGDATEAAYRRGDLYEKRTELMNAWSVFCAGNKLI